LRTIWLLIRSQSGTPIAASHRGAASEPRVRPNFYAGLWQPVGIGLAGGIILAGVSWVCFQFGFSIATTAFIYLLVIVMLSLLDSFMASVFVSCVAVGSLNYFFAEPRFTFRVNLTEDAATLSAFLATALVVSGLIGRTRKSAEHLRERALLLDLTQDAVRKEAALHRSRAANLAEAQKLSHTGSFGWDPATGKATWSDETFRIFGYDPAIEPSTALVLERTHPDDVPAVRRAIARSADTGEGFNMEHRLRMGDGSIKHLHVVVHPSRDEHGQLRFIGAVMDVTSRRVIEEALRSSEYRYDNMFRAMAASFWELDFSGATALVRPLLKSGVTDLRGYLAANPAFVREMMHATRVVDVNEQSAALFGLSKSAASLGSVEPFWPEESAHFYAESYVRAVERQPNYSTECKLRRADGSFFDALFTVAYPPDIAHAKTIMVGVIDVTARKQSEAALRASEVRYKNLFQAMAVAFFELDFSKANELLRELRRSGVTDVRRHLKENPALIAEIMLATRVVDVNDRTVALFGRGNKEELLSNTERFWPRESWGDYAEAIMSSVGKNLEFSVETKLRRLDGSVFDAHFTVWYSSTDKTSGLAGVLDITERKSAQARLRQVEADFAHAARVSMLGELTASIAHEVNQPLAAITTNAEAGLRWLDRPVPDVPEVRQLTKRIVSDAQRAADVIARIRSMATRRGPEHTQLSLDEVVRDAVLFLRHEFQSQGVAVSVHLSPSTPKVRADRIQLQQVIVNLAVNAAQALAIAGTAEPTIIFRTAASATGEALCSVEDNGPGIAPEVHRRLFESFFTTKDGGMGMGLPICRSIIEAHGGRMTADSNGTGKGARFSFSLPATKTSN
jgi:PAS domain S-box-containing protein